MSEDRSALHVGLASACITPKEPVWLYGYAGKSRYRPFAGILDDIHAKALAVQDADGQKAVLITADLCVLRAPEESRFAARIMQRTGLSRSQILLAWSHTHSGPAIGSSDLNRYPMSDRDLRQTLAYSEILSERLAEVAARALADLAPAALSFGRGQVAFVKSRRVYDEQGKYQRMGPNPAQPVDRRVPVLRIDAPGGRLRGLVFGCACHAVTLGMSSTKLSGDYPGLAQQCLERSLPGVQAMFVAGCGADANPDPRGGPQQEQTVRQQGECLAAEVRRVAEGRMQTVRGPFQAQLARVDLPLQPAPSAEELRRLAQGPFWQSLNAKRMLAAQERGEPLPGHYRAPLALWQFGKDLTVVGISGEVVSDYVPLIEKVLGQERLWIAGYTNQVFGYLPSARIVAEGGYESLGLPSGPVGWFSAKAQDVILDKLRKMAQQAGRQLPS
jgi:hypothetical protein